VAAVILVVALGGLSSAVVSGRRISRISDEEATAREAAFAQLEALQATDFADRFALFNGDPVDDPGGLGTAPGDDFDVPGLIAQPDDADGLPGRILFPTVDLGGGVEQLREDVVDNSLGMPRDLNGDGDVDALDHSADYILLPVTVRVEWKGAAGMSSLDVEVMLVQ